MKALIATAIALVFAASASAANNGSISVRVCSATKTVQSTNRIGPRTNVYPRVFVNGHPLQARVVGTRSARWTGYGVIAQLWQSSSFAPLTFRVASVRSGCANVRLNYVLR
jgi:hypothetical protein